MSDELTELSVDELRAEVNTLRARTKHLETWIKNHLDEVTSVREELGERKTHQLRAEAERDGAIAEASALRRERDALRVRTTSLETALKASRDALNRAAEAINESEGWHDENSDDNGEDTCEPSESCDCALPRMVNEALSLSRDAIRGGQ